MLIGELADHIVVDRTTLTRNLAVLEADRLVVLRASVDDARARRVTLSAKGRRVLERAMPLWESVQHQLRAQLGAAGWDRLAGSLADVVTARARR
jgi:DNA-binding MarR family transcriptional regulator